jgi:uncharacterized protein (TIGR02231 family)
MRTLLVFFILGLSSIAARAQDTLNVKHKLVQATVYLKNAELIHEASVRLPAGTHVLVFGQLPTNIFQNSVQLQMQGGATLLSVKYEINYLQNAIQKESIEALRRRLEQAELQVARLEARKASLAEEQDLLLKNKQISGTQNGLSAEQLRQMADFYGRRLLEIKNRLIDTEQELKAAREEYQKLQQQLKAQAHPKPSGEVKAVVRCQSPATLQLKLRYLAHDAAWYPQYELRVADTDTPVELSYKAMVMQRTGIDWDNITLHLSTGNPSVSGTKPELNPWFIDFINTYAYQKHYEVKKSRRTYAEPDNAVEEAAPPLMAEVEPTTAADFTEVNESGLQVRFEIGIPVSLSGDGKEQLVDIQKHEVSADYTYAAVPKAAPEAFLMARIYDWAKMNLLPGAANVYFAGNYVGTTSLDPALTGDTLVFSLGRDARIVCLHKEVRDFTTKRFLKNDIEEERAYEISIRNNRKENIELSIEDQIPVSKQNRISVEAIELSGGQLNPQTGIVRWQLKLAPGQEVKKRLHFKVKYPKGSRIQW